MDKENDEEEAEALGWTKKWGDDDAGAGALSPMSRLVTLLAVDAMALADVGGATSSTGEIRPAAVEAAALAASADALFLPKLSFHLDGFLVTGAGGAFTVGAGAGATGLAKSAEGTAYMDTGSKGFLTRAGLLEPERWEDDLEAMLISRASDWDASARVASVLSCGEVGLVGIVPLPFLAPRFRRLLVDVDRDVMPSISTSTSPSSASASSSLS